EILRLTDIFCQIIKLSCYFSRLPAILSRSLPSSRITGRPVFPWPLSHGQSSRTARRVIDQVISQLVLSRANQRGEDVEAVRPRFIVQRLMSNRRECGQHIDMAYQLIRDCGCFDLARPTRDERNSMTAFE